MKAESARRRTSAAHCSPSAASRVSKDSPAECIICCDARVGSGRQRALLQWRPDMESKFRSLPLSIIDFVGVIIPGFAWLVLIITANAMLSLSHDPATPVAAWTTMSDAVQGANGWIGGLMLAICAIVIGYVAK